mmetsp:Transcript_139279/g.445276  ORF Transcript_139279/g.445276 Transcript_139279/m.445276 type:complete len:109 (+) Transcript_139279:95-421(+)
MDGETSHHRGLRLESPPLERLRTALGLAPTKAPTRSGTDRPGFEEQLAGMGWPLTSRAPPPDGPPHSCQTTTVTFETFETFVSFDMFEWFEWLCVTFITFRPDKIWYM